MKYSIRFIVALLFFTVAVNAQPYYFRHYQVENGLSNSTVHCCLQDKKGFIWMGTKDGLDRFDGYTFKAFRHDEDDSTSIGSNFLKSIYEDKKGIIYAGTHNGLFRYNDSIENFTALKTGGEVRDIKEDGNNNLWYIIDAELYKYDLKTGLHHPYPRNKYFYATSVCITKDNEVWVSTASGLLEKYDAEKNSFTAYDVFAKSLSTGSKWIEKIYSTSHNTIFIGTSTHGVKVFDIGNKQYSDILTYNADKTAIFARDFIQTDTDEYWIATESGIFIYNMKNNSFINLKKQYNDPYSISDNAVYALCKDREGGIWAGTFFGGINYFPKQYTEFKKYFPDYSKNSLSGNAVREICKDKYGNFWIGTEDAGLNKFDPSTGIFTHYKPTGAKTDIAYYNIHGLLADGNKLWIGTFEHGLDIMDIRTGKVVKHYSEGDGSLLAGNFVVTIYKTRTGEIFIGTWGGLQKYDAAIDKFIRVNEVPPNFIYGVYEDEKGTIWASTIDNGIYYFNEKTKVSGNLRYDPHNKNSIGSNFILDIFEDSNKYLWFGTEGGGLCKYNRASNTFKRYNSKTGFPSNTVLKILEDSKKKLWITTTRGLVHFDPVTDAIKVYTKANGLLNDQFNYNSGFKDATGKMYFGSVKGMICFDPNTFSQNNFVPPVYITGMQVNNKELTIDDKNSPLKKSIFYTNNISLKYNQSSFSIDFASLSYTAPEITRYAYKMEGLDKNWTYLATNRKVYFTNLPAGEYVFKVKAANSIDTGNQQVRELNIHVTPPFWATRWAYLLYIIICGSLLYYLVRTYHRMQENKKEKAIYKANIEFFTNIAHEIKTPLTLIKGPVENLSEMVSDVPAIKEDVITMERNTNRLVNLINQILDFRQTETKGFSLDFSPVNINEILLESYLTFEPVAKKRKLSYSIDMPSTNINTMADAEALNKIFTNLFSNATKYAEKKVNIKLITPKKEEEKVIIEISNDGFIIPKGMKEKLFEPFFRLKETIKQKGTGIGLALARSLVELHNGDIYLKDPEDGMNIFVVILPYHSDQQKKKNRTEVITH